MDNEIIRSTEVVHWVTIKVRVKPGGELVEFLHWSGLKWKLRLKWDWYFNYRAALAQVQHPKYGVEYTWGHKPAKGKSLDEIRKVKIISKKAQISKYENLLLKAKQNWNQLFPIEDDEMYRRAVAKVDRLKCELETLNQYKP